MIDLNQKNKFEQIWDKGDYRLGSTAQRMLPLILEVIPENATINDYGCGTGRMEVELIRERPKQNVTMIDIAENALEYELIYLKFILADLTDLSSAPHADWGICINVLMTVQPDNLDTILKEIRRTCDNLIMEVYDFDDSIRLGLQLTTVKKNAAEWMDKLKEHWQDIECMQSPESKQRYIFICRE
jgi:trans-aconitate methyltransferase